MHAFVRLRSRRSLLVLTASAIVHVSVPAQVLSQAKPKSAGGSLGSIPRDEQFPPAVSEMIDLIRAAIESGRIEDLRDAVDWNEMKPDFGIASVGDPVAHWKAGSKDGSGREILAVLGALLDGPPAIVPYGKDLENNRLFVWPRFADAALDAMTGDDKRHFERLVGEPDRDSVLAQKAYRGWRLVLGADGTWHSFRKRD